MAKTKNAIVDDFAAELDADLAAIYDGLSEEDKAELSVMSLEEKMNALQLAGSLKSSSNVDVVFNEVSANETENINILIPGGFGLRAGTEITAYLMGTYHVISKSVKENWKELVDEDGTVYYYNNYYKFRDINGTIFGIWASPTLSILQKIPTHSATPSLVKADPLVRVKYIGKVEGKEILKQEYGIELSKGNSSHVFITSVAGNVVFDRYVKGCINHLNSPTPKKTKKSGLTSFEASKANYERIMAVQAGADSSDFTKLLAQ